jgi:integrase
MARIREAPGTAARALEFTILSASRTGETLGMRWDELSADGKVWTVPAARMKEGEPHVVYLSREARAVLERVRGLSETWVFRSSVGDTRFSDMAMLQLLRRLEVADRTTVHGMRSSFSTWANEVAKAREDVVEACLAHREQDRVRAAYNRSAYEKERAQVLAKWARFLGEQS